MLDRRKPWETKTFWGLAALALAMLLNHFPATQPAAIPVAEIGALWTGWSITDRLRNK
jgi:hypothetical protein